MCTIDPLMCWYYDNPKYWEAHPDELKLAHKFLSRDGMSAFLSDYVQFRRLVEEHEHKSSISV